MGKQGHRKEDHSNTDVEKPGEVGAEGDDKPDESTVYPKFGQLLVETGHLAVTLFRGIAGWHSVFSRVNSVLKTLDLGNLGPKLRLLALVSQRLNVLALLDEEVEHLALGELLQELEGEPTTQNKNKNKNKKMNSSFSKAERGKSQNLSHVLGPAASNKLLCVKPGLAAHLLKALPVRHHDFAHEFEDGRGDNSILVLDFRISLFSKHSLD